VGSIQERRHESGRVVWRARYRLADGRERSKSFALKVDAEKWLRARMAEVDKGQGQDLSRGRVKFAAIADDWQRSRRNFRPKTIDTTASHIRARILPTFGRLQVSAIRPRTVEDWVLAQQSEGLAAGTIRAAFGVLRSILARAVREERIATNPADSVRLRDLLDVAPKPDRVSILEPAEVADLITAMPTWWRPMTIVLYGSGARIGEVAALQRDDFDGAAIMITKTLTESTQGVRLGPPKTPESVRTVPLPPSVCEVIEATPRFDRSPFLFTTVRGNPVRPTAYAGIFSRSAKAIGRPDSTPHTLRHSHASLLFHEGASLIAVSQRLGHRNPQVTLNTYAHLMKGADDHLADVLEPFTRPIRGLIASLDPEKPNNDGV